MTTTHSHRKYTMSPAALAQRRAARAGSMRNRGTHIPIDTVSVGIHITPQAMAVVKSYKRGKPRREFMTSAILAYSRHRG